MTAWGCRDMKQNVGCALDGDLIAGTRIRIEEFDGNLRVTCDDSSLGLGLRRAYYSEEG
jgi:hypothetical protein